MCVWGGGKLLEWVIALEIEAHVASKCGLTKSQYGFQASRLTNDVVLHVQKIINTICSKDGLCAAVGLDVRNAFNTLPWKCRYPESDG